MLQTSTSSKKFLLDSSSKTYSNHTQNKLISNLKHAPNILDILLRAFLALAGDFISSLVYIYGNGGSIKCQFAAFNLNAGSVKMNGNNTESCSDF